MVTRAAHSIMFMNKSISQDSEYNPDFRHNVSVDNIGLVIHV